MNDCFATVIRPPVTGQVARVKRAGHGRSGEARDRDGGGGGGQQRAAGRPDEAMSLRFARSQTGIVARTGALVHISIMWIGRFCGVCEVDGPRTDRVPELILRRATPTLVLVDRVPLLNQWRDLHTFLGLPKEAIGQVGGGKNRLP
jgi:hypothetical protein